MTENIVKFVLAAIVIGFFYAVFIMKPLPVRPPTVREIQHRKLAEKFCGEQGYSLVVYSHDPMISGDKETSISYSINCGHLK